MEPARTDPAPDGTAMAPGDTDLAPDGTEGSARPTPMIRGERVWLRPPEPVDIDLFLGWFNDAEATHFLALRAPIGRAEEERWLARALEQQGKEAYTFVVCVLHDDRPIGTAGLMEIDRVNGSAGFGIAIGEKALWNRGYGTDALNAIVDFAFGELRLERIWLDCFAYNSRARRSYEKAGFTVEGVRRRALFHRGAYVDVLHMALLRDEWAELARRKSWELPPPAGRSAS